MLTGILVKEMADCSAFWETVVKNTLSLLFVQFSRDLASPETGIIRRLFRWLEETAGQPSLEAFAKAEGYSADYVGKLIKGNTGRSFRELATESRQKKRPACCWIQIILWQKWQNSLDMSVFPAFTGSFHVSLE